MVKFTTLQGRSGAAGNDTLESQVTRDQRPLLSEPGITFTPAAAQAGMESQPVVCQWLFWKQRNKNSDRRGTRPSSPGFAARLHVEHPA